MIIYLSMLDTEQEQTKFEQLYNRYRYTMLYTANSILQDMSLAEDAVHDAFIRIAKNFHKVGPVDSPATKGFVVVITRNVALSMKQKDRSYIIPEDENIISATARAKGEDPFAKAVFGDIVDRIIRLPPIYKDVIYLRFVNGLSVKAIGEILQLRDETVKKRIQRGRKILIDKLYREGIVNER